ncbi:hypothetical protein EV421DRAFT_1981861 [Armillaria borealis]|uniref:Uncharacterized protein n=1 Tax=Armillaria borealis TaxID=47425 RepID=A0AA39MJ02_9AGAR|nr:hypothetical protein EV421DRAFT_1981861 [Armillaria borealis]
MSPPSPPSALINDTLPEDNTDYLDSFLNNMASSISTVENFSPLPPLGINTEDSESGIIPPPATTPFAMSLDFSLASHASLIKQLKQVKSFSKESALDLDNFSVAPTIEECYTFIFAVTLETRDLLKELVKKKTAEVFEIKDSVKLAMQANNTPDLPSKQDIIGKDKVIREINSALSDSRHWLKSKLSETLKKANPETDNIGAVTSRILGNSGIPVTLQLHMRVAVVRWHLSHFSHLVPKKFWPHVDDFLARSLEKGQQSYSTILNNMYSRDMDEYGNHDLAKFPVLDLLNESSSVDAWIITDNTFYDKIRPQKLAAKDRVQPQFTEPEEDQAGGKRKRTIGDVGGPEEEV